MAQFLTFIALLRCAFYHAQCGHKGRENPDIVNSQSLSQATAEAGRQCSAVQQWAGYGGEKQQIENG